MQVDERHPLKWPDGFGRTLIDERKDARAWKKQASVYIGQIKKELELLGAKTVVLSWNTDAEAARRDPGVAIWFSMERKKDTSWQRTLQIDNPNPTREEVDSAFKRLSKKHHPDSVAGGSGGDVKMYMKLEEAWRNAKAWVTGDEGFNLQNCLPCDLYTEPRYNMAALKLTLGHLRALQRLGNPFIVESMMERGLRTALPAGETVNA